MIQRHISQCVCLYSVYVAPCRCHVAYQFFVLSCVNVIVIFCAYLYVVPAFQFKDPVLFSASHLLYLKLCLCFCFSLHLSVCESVCIPYSAPMFLSALSVALSGWNCSLIASPLPLPAQRPGTCLKKPSNSYNTSHPLTKISTFQWNQQESQRRNPDKGKTCAFLALQGIIQIFCDLWKRN